MTEEKKPAVIVGNFAVPVEVTEERVRHLLCSAFEGGSNYWYMIEGYKYAPGLKEKDFTSKKGKHHDGDWGRPYTVPFVPGCAIIISDMEGDDSEKRYELDRAALERGLKVMAEKYAHHWADFVKENDDAITADVFLQCCLFGDCIYG